MVNQNELLAAARTRISSLESEIEKLRQQSDWDEGQYRGASNRLARMEFERDSLLKDIQSLRQDARALAEAASSTLIEQRREFIRGDIQDLDRLEDALSQPQIQKLLE